MFYTVFSTDSSPAMQWQSELLEYSWKRVGQEGTLIRLDATDTPRNLPQHKYAHRVATRPWSPHPETGDHYPIYNKPASLLEWVYRDRPEGTVLLLDPDCVFTKPVTRRVATGAPVAQKWVDFNLGEPSAERPFGLPPAFSFLTEHCARVDLPADPVMIPTLIHTSDLRKLSARWLQLCSIVRQNYRDGDGNPAWESDMYAYVVACAEYGLRHEPASLGICTNWRSEDAPDPAIIHYCQPIKASDGTEIFYKHHYAPWRRIDTALEPSEDYGRALVTLVNASIDATRGVVTPPALYTRPRRCAGIMEGRVVDDILLEKPEKGGSLWLNGTGKAVWDLCDGSRTIKEMGEELCEQFAGEPETVTADAAAVIGQLHAAAFLDVA
jgi:hypothetical protein